MVITYSEEINFAVGKKKDMLVKIFIYFNFNH